MPAVGETKITGKNQISIPARGMRELGWTRGDELLVQVLGPDMLLLTRRPRDWVEAYSGKMGDVFGDHEDNLRYLEGERRTWDPDSAGVDRASRRRAWRC